jgi:hypothetical protein
MYVGNLGRCGSNVTGLRQRLPRRESGGGKKENAAQGCPSQNLLLGPALRVGGRVAAATISRHTSLSIIRTRTRHGHCLSRFGLSLRAIWPRPII